MNLTVIGTSFRTAPLELREKLSFKANDIPRMLRCLKRFIPDAEFVLLTTCNRTELYAAGNSLRDYQGSLALIFTQAGHLHEQDDLEKHLYRKENLAAVEHIFSVASSLDSMVIGEREILGQVKWAYAVAQEAGTTGAVLNPLFQKALKVAKYVQTHTAICRGHVSVSSGAGDFAEKICNDLAAKTVLIVGAGETSELTLQHLREKGVKRILVLNRSPDRGKALADKYGGKAIQYDLLDDYLPKADIVVSSTNAPHCVIRTNSVRKAIAARCSRPMLFIDIAVPRDIEESVGRLENVYLYNIDDLQGVAAENLARRQECLTLATSIVHEQTGEFAAWFRAQNFGTLIRRMEQAADELRESELARVFAKDELASLPESARHEIRHTMHRIINRILAAPKHAIRDAAKNGHGEDYVRILRHLCGFDKEAPHDHE